MTRDRWRAVTQDVQNVHLWIRALASIRGYFNWLYYQEFLQPTIECALSNMLESGAIFITDLAIYSKSMESTADFLLTRFREEPQLLTLIMHVDRVKILQAAIDAQRAKIASETGPQGFCKVDRGSPGLVLRSLTYSRGSSVQVHFNELLLEKGKAYAVTGPNGCGKSSLFSVLASCGNRAPSLPEGIEVEAHEGSLVLPSDDLAEITQSLYCPLFIRPMEWLTGLRDLDQRPIEEVEALERRIAQLSAELRFRSTGSASASGDEALRDDTGLTHEDLWTEQADWYGQLSGGQRSKAEFMRQVLLRPKCPEVLVIDEAFAPLDPHSKVLVQRKLKESCLDSLILAIYHTEAQESCIAGGFFDASLRFGNGTAALVAAC